MSWSFKHEIDYIQVSEDNEDCLQWQDEKAA